MINAGVDITTPTGTNRGGSGHKAMVCTKGLALGIGQDISVGEIDNQQGYIFIEASFRLSQGTGVETGGGGLVP
jgi:hypothetical protein